MFTHSTNIVNGLKALGRDNPNMELIPKSSNLYQEDGNNKS